MSSAASPATASGDADGCWLSCVEQLSITCSCSGALLSTDVRLFPADVMLTAKQLQQQPTGQRLHDYIQPQTKEARAQQQQPWSPVPSASSLSSLLSAQNALLCAAAAFNNVYDADLAHLLTGEEQARESESESLSLAAALQQLASLHSSPRLEERMAAAAYSQAALSSLLPLLQRRASSMPAVAAAVEEQRVQELQDWAAQLQATLTDAG